MTRRLVTSLLLAGAVGASVPALAALVGSRAADADPPLVLAPASPAFTLAGMIPGDRLTRCLVVSNAGPSAMKLVEFPTLTGALAPYLRVTVERGTGVGDEAPSCAKFVPASPAQYSYGTRAGGVPVTELAAETTGAFAGGSAKSLRVTVAMPADTDIAAAAKQGSLAFNFIGTALPTPPTPTTPGGPPDLPGGIAPGTAGGFDKNGNFLTNSQIKKRLRIGRARLLKNGDIVVKMYLPAGGAIRAKAIMTNGVYYAHTLLPVEWGPTVRVLLRRRPVGKAATVRHRRERRQFVLRITTRYRWAHGPKAFVQPEQKLMVVRGKR